MTSELRVRPMRPADATRAEAVFEAALRDADAYFEDAPDDGSVGAVLDGDGVFLVGELDGRVVATGGLRDPAGQVTELYDQAPDAGELKRMHVDPAVQRRGYGRRMLAALTDRARERGHGELVLVTSTLQTSALAFYEAAGFEAVARAATDAEGETFEVVCYRRPLPSRRGRPEG